MVNKFKQDTNLEWKDLEEKERPIYKWPKCWWGDQPLKWGKTSTKLTTFTEWKLWDFASGVDYKKVKVH
jgi:hypothetical protein